MRRYFVHIIFFTLVICHGSVEAQIVDSVCASAGPSHLAVPTTPGNSYQWNLSGGSILSGQGTNDIEVQWPASTGVYTASVIEFNPTGCSDTVYAQVYVEAWRSSQITAPTDVCAGQWVQLQATDSNTPGTYYWNDGTPSTVTGFTAQSDTLIYRVAENELCENDTVFHFIRVFDVPQALMTDNSGSDTLGFDSEVDFQYTGIPGSQVDWYLNDQWIGTGSQMNIEFTTPGWNKIELVTQSGVCSDTTIRYFYLAEQVRIHLPSAFSPNGDHVNDIWSFSGTGFDRFEASIYNRWGQIVYTWNDDPSNGWDGTYGGQDVPTGVYTYKVRVWTRIGKVEEYKGAITVIR